LVVQFAAKVRKKQTRSITRKYDFGKIIPKGDGNTQKKGHSDPPAGGEESSRSRLWPPL